MGQQVKIRRATAASIASKTPVEAELGWVTDEKRLVVGDGITAGGVRVAMESDIPELGDYAPVDSPVLTGNPQAPTPSPGDDDQSIATTGFVKAAIDAVLGGVSAAFDTMSELAAGLKGLGALTLVAGDILYASGANTLARLAKSTNGHVLTLSGGIPAWAAPAAAAGTARNRIVNPAMQISSVNGNSAGTSSGYAVADNWLKYHVSSAGTLTAQRVQSVTPKGAKDRIRVTITAADASLAAGELLTVTQNIVGQEIADFQYGTASAKQVLLRFLFKGPQGTYAVALHNAAANRSYVALFTIGAGEANTDTIQEITIAGDTTGTWTTTSATGLTLDIVLACGSTFQGSTGWQAGNILGTSGVSNGMGTISDVFEIGEVGLYLDVAASGSFPVWELPSWGEDVQDVGGGQFGRIAAFVNFDGTRNVTDTGASTNSNPVKIRGSSNVTSVVKNAAGDYTVNLTIALPDASYSLSGSCDNAFGAVLPHDAGTARTASAFRIRTLNSGGMAADTSIINVHVVR